MDIVILDSAFKHGISEESIMYCLSHYNNDMLINYPPEKRVFAGFDDLGRALELIAVEEEGRLVVIHAMKLSPKYYFLLEGGYNGI